MGKQLAQDTKPRNSTPAFSNRLADPVDRGGQLYEFQYRPHSDAYPEHQHTESVGKPGECAPPVVVGGGGGYLLDGLPVGTRLGLFVGQRTIPVFRRGGY